MVYKTGIAILISLQFIFSPLAYSQQKNPNVLFEGYSKILLGGVHAGYVVLRYEFDPKKKQFHATYLVKTGDLGGNILESLKAVADQELKPISYEYTSLVDKQQTKIIDAKFTKDQMVATVKHGKTQKKLIEKLPKGAFLGIFLYYVILRSPSGLKTETRYDYKAVAEEDAKIQDGVAIIGKEEKFNGIRAFKASNTFKDVKYVFYLTDTGEALMSETPAANLKTILVAKPQEATAKFPVPTGIMKSLFGEVPLGLANTVSRNLKAEAAKISEPTPTKQDGIQPDSRIMIKD
jgi:hypothetical protein